jgi:cyclic beta-1,2-glucan synthetase
MNEAFTIPPAEEAVGAETMERLRQAAEAAASWEVVPRPSTRSYFPLRVFAARQALRSLELDLARQQLPQHSSDPEVTAQRTALLEIGASHRLFRAAVSAVSDELRRIAELPRLPLGAREDEPRIAGVARAYLEAIDGVFSAATFSAFVRALQALEPLNIDELWNFGTFLKFAMLEMILGESRDLVRVPDARPAPLLLDHITCLRAITNADWVYLIEPLITFDKFLEQDPAGVFASMDFESRGLYRKRIAQAARRSNCAEWQVAQAALELAQEARAYPATPDPRVQQKREHVGFYLVSKGFPQLAARIGFHPSLAWRMRRFVLAHAESFFLDGIVLLTIILTFAALFPVLPQIDGLIGLFALLILICIPASQDAVDLVNSAITAYLDPEPLPKLDFKDTIPSECTTLVAVPTLLLDEKQVRKLINDLEVRFLGNRDPNLHFALLTDLADSVSKPRQRDFHPLVELAVRLIDELNAKYAPRGNGAFLLLHRHRVFNTRQGVWMGWERKRGKLLDLNKLLAHEFDAFPIKAGPVGVLEKVRYVLTLDSDSQLPRGAAARLVGAIAHPLNQAVIDPRRRLVREGFGILQPRISVAVRSTASSRLAAIYSGQGGLDLYTRAISDAYQDLFGEGIFTGKGIYEVATLHAVLDRRFPRDFLLSHDLIEGAYARAGLVSDVELVDDYPSRYSAYIRRKHRWLRGDWQIAQWIFSRVPDESGKKVTNPISSVSRWKILDNLRRSLVHPAFFFLFLAGWIFLPGGALYWTIVPLIMLFFSAAAQFLFSLGRVLSTGNIEGMGQTVSGLGQAARISFLSLAFLPHETLLAFDAILRALIRRFVTGERLLEWETAAQSELQTGLRSSGDRYLVATPAVAVAAGALVWLLASQHWAFFCALPVLALWIFAAPIAEWLNRSPSEQHRISPGDREYLIAHALRIWRYFHQFSSERHHYLIPDNVREEGLREAARISPTNIGLLLNARQAARELGFITTPEFAALTGLTLGTIARLQKYRGNLYNWYDTQSLQPLEPSRFISSVDSGNLVASLYTLHSGARALAERPLLAPELFHGLHAHLLPLSLKKNDLAARSRTSAPGEKANQSEWIAWLPHAKTVVAEMAASPYTDSERLYWIREAGHRIEAINRLVENYLPWLLPEFETLHDVQQLGLNRRPFNFNCAEALEFAEELRLALSTAHLDRVDDGGVAGPRERLLDLLPATIDSLRNLLMDLQKIEREAERLAQEMDFSFLVDPWRRILSIGFEMGAQRRHSSCYDLIASEARIATFLAIARGDIPQQSWLKLGREHTFAYGSFLLLSWSGTMFEYLMPALWMRTYSGTMIAQTQEACVKVQQAFGREHGIPWGVSESGASNKNDHGDYDYFAYGIPRLGLWFEANAGPVISPYSTFLALSVDPTEAIRNLRRMESARWTGAYGFYEAGDYSVAAQGPVLVKEWMTHHMGMSLLAIVNLLCDNVAQQWFHEHPVIQAAEMLLHEMPVKKALLKARLKEVAPIGGPAEVPPRGRKDVKAAL